MGSRLSPWSNQGKAFIPRIIQGFRTPLPANNIPLGLRQVADLVAELDGDGTRVTDVRVGQEGADEVHVDLTLRVATDQGAADPDESTTSVDLTVEGSPPVETGTRADSGSEEGPSGEFFRGSVSSNGTDDNLPAGSPVTPSPSTGDERDEASPTESTEPAGVDESTESADADSTSGSTPTEDDATETGDFPCPLEDCDRVFGSEHGAKVHVGKVHDSDGDVAPYRDPTRLQQVYDEYDTFAEMAAAFDRDVSAQTVRRHAVDLGIHDPGGGDGDTDDDPEASADGSTTDEPEPSADDPPAADPESSTGDSTDDGEPDGGEEGQSADSSAPPASTENAPSGNDEADGTAEPEAPSSAHDPTEEIRPGITVVALRDAVESASTVYEVQQALDVDRDEALAVLEETELLELVCGRAAKKRERDRRKTEIDQRLESAL